MVAALALLATACTFTIEANINTTRTNNALNALERSGYLAAQAAAQAAQGCVLGAPSLSTDLVGDYGGQGGAGFAELADTEYLFDYPSEVPEIRDGDATLAIWQRWMADPQKSATILDPRWDSLGVGQATCPSGDIYITAVLRDDSGPMDLIQQDTQSALGQPLETDFYRNNTYECGLSGNYTFLVLNPATDPTAEAPLWVYLHGGGQGYWDDQGTYQTIKWQTQDTWNHEESNDDLQNTLLVRILDGNGQPEDQTVKRRIDEGYRVLVVSMCDHDLYSGQGTPYPNHPTNPNAEVNGLQATMAAIDYTAANYPTTHVWAHGTSAGSPGVWALASTYGQAGIPLTGIVADSGVATPNFFAIYDAYLVQDQYPLMPTWTPEGLQEKVGDFVNESLRLYPEAQIVDNDFRSVPGLFFGGDVDPFCAGNLPLVPEAIAAGLSNCGYVYSTLAQAIADQANSPHEFHLLPGTGHVPTNDPGPANDIVDDFIDSVLATNPPPFG